MGLQSAGLPRGGQGASCSKASRSKGPQNTQFLNVQRPHKVNQQYFSVVDLQTLKIFSSLHSQGASSFLFAPGLPNSPSGPASQLKILSKEEEIFMGGGELNSVIGSLDVIATSIKTLIYASLS